ncbi:hypothetical protein [uncultured Hyphomonas sp.]|uniref:hypothetical protein n=1 Tax=uncultured Hyphomonas sp. TaxID=225298 RepID=UPI002AAC3924|nr:hypothetical protein [uncultured Hyphomonas sp.]
MSKSSKLITHFENCAYLKSYYGMSRDIYVYHDHVEIIFRIILNDHVSFRFKRPGTHDDAVIASLKKYKERSAYLEAGLPYSSKAVMNSAVRGFIGDVLNDAVPMPDKTYVFADDKARLRLFLEDEECAFIWEDEE